MTTGEKSTPINLSDFSVQSTEGDDDEVRIIVEMSSAASTRNGLFPHPRSTINTEEDVATLSLEGDATTDESFTDSFNACEMSGINSGFTSEKVMEYQSNNSPRRLVASQYRAVQYSSLSNEVAFDI